MQKEWEIDQDISEGTNLSQIENWDKVNSPIDFSFIRNYVPKNPLLKEEIEIIINSRRASLFL
jgi:hypothetical protein